MKEFDDHDEIDFEEEQAFLVEDHLDQDVLS